MRQCQAKDNICSLIFFPQEFFMGTIMIFYIVAFSYFFTWFQEFLYKHLLYTSSDFSTEFFEDSIHSV
jgi:hypothetical protein